MQRQGTMLWRVSTWALLAFVLTLCSATAASAAEQHLFLGTFGSSSQPIFGAAAGMAVDQSTGDLLVTDTSTGKLRRFHEDGTPANFTALGSNELTVVGLEGKAPGEEQIAVDNSGGVTEGDIYVAVIAGAGGASSGAVDVYSESGASLGELNVTEPCGVAVAPSGTVYVGSYSSGESGEILEYEPSSNPPTNSDFVKGFASVHRPCTVAAGSGASSGSIFPSEFLGNTVKLVRSTGALPYVVYSGQTTTITVDPVNGHVLVAAGREVEEFDASGATGATLLSRFAFGDEKVSGVAVNGTNGDVFIAREGNPNIEEFGPAVIFPDATTSPGAVVGSTVTLRGVVSAAGGTPASCFFEYVAVGAKGFEGAATVPCSPAGPFTGSTALAVSAQLEGLPEGYYRFRLVARNELGTTDGNTLILDDTPAPPALPDGRAYELVSPAQKAGEVIPPSGSQGCNSCPGQGLIGLPMQASPDGQSVLYEGQPFAPGLSPTYNQYLGGRLSTGWSSTSLDALPITGQWRAFSSDLSRGILHQGEPPLSSHAPTRVGAAFANLYLLEEGGELRPINTVEPLHREPGSQGIANVFRIRYTSANSGAVGAPPFTHIIFEANEALTPAVPGIAPAAPEPTGEEECNSSFCDLYEWQNGALHLVNVLPDGNAAPEAVVGSGRLLSTISAEEANVTDSISSDGSHVFWTDAGTGRTYVRVDGTRTLSVPGPETCRESLSIEERVCFLTASADGRRVLFSNGQIDSLNPAATAYEPSADLTGGEGGFQGILGAADDLSRVYFVDTNALTPESEITASGEHAESGAFNLYLGEGEQTRFLGALVGSDDHFGTNSTVGVWRATASNRLAQVADHGLYLAFQSTASLTGYDNVGSCVEMREEPCSEVFEYDATTGILACASCNPSRQRPAGNSFLSLLPPTSPLESTSLRQPANLSSAGNGRIFFESEDSLTPRDINASVRDVYEWEPNGENGCARGDGCVALISSGDSSAPSTFLDSTPTGDDAFFVTRSRLSPSDKDDQYDLYDARVGGGFDEEIAAPCLGESCRMQAPSPPPQETPGTSSFTGPANRKVACGRLFVHKHGKCVKRLGRKPRHRHKNPKQKNHRKKAMRVSHRQGGSR